jgi:hypothetical protein
VLRIERHPAYAFTFKPVAWDTFQSRGVLARVRRDGAGKATAIVLSIARVRELRFDRLTAAP